MAPWVWPYPVPLLWCLPCLTGIMASLHPLDGMLHPRMRGQIGYYTPYIPGVHRLSGVQTCY